MAENYFFSLKIKLWQISVINFHFNHPLPIQLPSVRNSTCILHCYLLVFSYLSISPPQLFFLLPDFREWRLLKIIRISKISNDQMTVKILQRVFPLEGHFGNLIFHQKIQKVFGRPFCKIVFYVFFFSWWKTKQYKVRTTTTTKDCWMYWDCNKIPIFRFRFSYISLFSIKFTFPVYLYSTVGYTFCGKCLVVQKKVVFMEMSLGNVNFYCLDYLEFYMCKVLYNPISVYFPK